MGSLVQRTKEAIKTAASISEKLEKQDFELGDSYDSPVSEFQRQNGKGLEILMLSYGRDGSLMASYQVYDGPKFSGGCNGKFDEKGEPLDEGARRIYCLFLVPEQEQDRQSYRCGS